MSTLEDLFDKLPDDIFSKAMPVYGQAMSSLANNDAGRSLIEFSHRTAGKAVGGMISLTGAAGDMEAIDVAREFIEKFFGDITEFEEDSDDELVFSFDECPYGFCDDEHTGLCHSAMNLEEEIVEGLGGELVIEERIPEGAERCRFRVRSF